MTAAPAPQTSPIQKENLMATTYDPETADAGNIVAVPADRLVIDPNVRRDIARDASFVSSIRQYGILQPPVGWQDEDGLVHIEMGQRRTSAALEIGHPVVHVLVKPQRVAKSEQAAEAIESARIIEQLAENDHRAALSTADRAAAFQQLALFGMTEERIARKTNSPKALVSASLKIAQSPAAASAAEAHSLDLEQAATIAEFDDDPEARRQLEEQAAVDPEQLAHLAQRLREERLDEEAREVLRARVRAVGGEISEEWLGSELTEIRWLYRENEDGERTYITEEMLSGITGVVANIQPGYRGDENRGFRLNWYIRDPESQGIAGARARVGKEELTEEQKEAKKTAAREKRERKKAMLAATDLRREWIRTTLLSTRTRYTESHMAWIAGALLSAVGHLDGATDRTQELAFELLGRENADTTYGGNVETGESWVSPGRRHAARIITVDRATRVALAAAVARTEYIVGHEKADDFGADTRSARYLRTLRDWGYTLSDVERAIVEAADARLEAAAERLAAEGTDGAESEVSA